MLSYKARTRMEMLNSKLLLNINPGACQEVANAGLNITHFVIGVSYGGPCQVTFKQKLQDITDYYEKRFKLTATIKILFISKTFSLGKSSINYRR